MLQEEDVAPTVAVHAHRIRTSSKIAIGIMRLCIDHTFTFYSISCVALVALACEASIGVGTACTFIAIVCTSHTLISIYTRRVEIDRKRLH